MLVWSHTVTVITNYRDIANGVENILSTAFDSLLKWRFQSNTPLGVGGRAGARYN